MNEELDEALAELRRQHREIEPPPFLETRLRAATRPARLNWRWLWIPALAAGLVLAVIVGTPPKRPPILPQSEFMTVPGSEGLPTPMSTSILRLDLPRAELRQYGFNEPPTADQRIQMDFIVGDDGLARAIRFAGPVEKGIE